MSSIREALGVAHGDHPTFEQLEQVVDGIADDVTHEVVQSHCEVCAQCAAELSDLRELAAEPMPSVLPRVLAAAAAVAALVLIPVWLWLRQAPAPRAAVPHPQQKKIASTGYGRKDWDDAVREALERGTVAMPAQRWPRSDQQRGAYADGPAAGMHPVHEVIDSTTPTLSWRATPGRYVVSVYDNATRVAHSESLSKPEWQVTPPLERGRTYAWQVEVHRGNAIEQLPVPPAPPAQFQVLDTASSASLAEARSRFPDDHLLLGVLEARSGLQKAAADDLRAYAVQHPEDPKAASLVMSVE
jgi:flavin-binding protein dodecin